MAGDGLTDEQAREFWTKTKRNAPRPFGFVREVCEVALLGGALLVAFQFSESIILLGLYWLLLFTFALKLASKIAFPTEYDSPGLPVLIGVVGVFSITYFENVAIKSAASAAIVQLQSDKVEKLLRVQKIQRSERTRLYNEYAKAGCLSDERVLDKTYNYPLCNKLRVLRDQNDALTRELLKP